MYLYFLDLILQMNFSEHLHVWLVFCVMPMSAFFKTLFSIRSRNGFFRASSFFKCGWFQFLFIYIFVQNFWIRFTNKLFQSIFMCGWFYSWMPTSAFYNTLFSVSVGYRNGFFILQVRLVSILISILISEHLLHVWLVLFVECQRQQHNKADSASSVW